MTDTPAIPAIRPLKTPLGMRHFQSLGNGLWAVHDPNQDDDETKAIEAPDDASDKTLIYALMIATAVW